ncbi:hypothetical protein HG537_0D01310 [Torulaspora globosa]|uniref:Uncharacterized protein n=1 Tax=Torulaspora globosa TaxID=48254 RepID=A0A7H9HS56_9SACH|nr:hypothetical protein HG537_0D01310 [Torulaspora sp. CBS 2947]
MDSSSDNFDYVFQLIKVLGSECRANRQESDKIESILRKLAKQSGLSYDQLSEKVSESTRQKYDEASTPDSTDRLILENYNLIYEIELQEYLNRRIWNLIQEIIEHLNSIRGFIIERKLTGTQTIDYYIQDKFDLKVEQLRRSNESLQDTKRITGNKLAAIYDEIRIVLGQISWDDVPNNFKERERISEILLQLKDLYGVDLMTKVS